MDIPELDVVGVSDTDSAVLFEATVTHKHLLVSFFTKISMSHEHRPLYQP